MKEICGNCKFNKYDPDGSGVRRSGCFYCTNERSENYAVPTFKDDTCDEYEPKEY